LQIRAGSLDTPADATGALAVGAINQATDTLEPFSSSGPTDGPSPRNKPEICGPDFTLTHQTSLNPFTPGTFPGTSAATPHVAGGAALLLDQNPSLTVDQLRNKLINEARTGAYSVNNLCGGNSGALSLQAASTGITITTNTDKLFYDRNEVVQVSGQVSAIISGAFVSLSVTNPNGNVVEKSDFRWKKRMLQLNNVEDHYLSPEKFQAVLC